MEKKGKNSTRIKNQYNSRVYDSLRIVVPKGRKSDIASYAEAHGVSINSLVNGLLRDAMQWSEEDWKKIKDTEE